MENETNTTQVENTKGDAAGRVLDLTRVLRATAVPVLEAGKAVTEASEALKGASDVATGTRMATLITFAAMSQQGQWDPSELKLAVAKAVAQENEPKSQKTLKTFLGEVQAAAHPRARAHVPFLADICKDAWDTEGLGDKDAPKPCRKAFVRNYAMTVRAIRLVAEGGRLLEDVQGITAWAVENDPDKKLDTVMAKVEKYREELQKFSANFPLPAFDEIDALFGSVTKGALARAMMAREKAEGDATADRMAAHRLAPVPAVIRARSAAPTVVKSAPGIGKSEVVVDHVADILGETVAEDVNEASTASVTEGEDTLDVALAGLAEAA